MIYIAHRGNIDGPSEDENTPGHIRRALDKGYDVEVDVWRRGKKLYLGHDEPTTPVFPWLLNDDRVWCHAKNIDALEHMLSSGYHCFFHDTDDVTLTSRGFMWTFPGKQLTELSVCVSKERGPMIPPFVAGLCSDYVADYAPEPSV